MNKTKKAVFILTGVGALLAAWVGLVVFVLGPQSSPLTRAIRSAGLLGYYSVFLAIVISEYKVQLKERLGKPFLWVHHVFAVAGLILLTVHPISVAIRAASPAVFVPIFISWRIFLTNGGRVAFYLLGAASLIGLLRKQIGKGWKLIHYYINYAAFALGTIHALLLGEDTGLLIVRIVHITLAAIIVYVFIDRRIIKARQKRLAAKRA